MLGWIAFRPTLVRLLPPRATPCRWVIHPYHPCDDAIPILQPCGVYSTLALYGKELHPDASDFSDGTTRRTLGVLTAQPPGRISHSVRPCLLSFFTSLRALNRVGYFLIFNPMNTMAGRRLFALSAFLVNSISLVCAVSPPFEMTWSEQTYSPDGPWQAVQVSVGSYRQNVTVYPGGQFWSNLLSSEVCSNATLGNVCYALIAGVYNIDSKSTMGLNRLSLSAWSGPNVISTLPAALYN